MTKSGSPSQFTVTIRDFADWSQQLQAETDRGLATAAAAILDHMLARLLEGFLVDDPKATKRLLVDTFSPLGTFAARTAAAYSLGLITADERDDLDCIREIRNGFVHKPASPSYTDEPIAKKVRNLKIPALIPKELLGPATESPREIFRKGVSMLYTFLDIRTRTNQDRRVQPKKFTMVSTLPA